MAFVLCIIVTLVSMASTQLSIKYRPTTFAETVGQEQAKSTLIAVARAEGITARSLLMTGAYGSGKCVSGDSMVLTNLGLRPIRSLFPDDMYPNSSKSVEGLSVFVHGKFEPVSHLYFSGLKPSIKIETSIGSRLEGSYHHPVKRWNSETCCFDWVCLEDLKEGDLLCTDTSTPDFSLFSSEFLSLPASYPLPKFTYKKAALTKSPTVVDSDFCYFLGLMGGDGCYTKNALSFLTCDQQLYDWMSSYTVRFGGCRLSDVSSRYSAQAWQFDFDCVWKSLFKHLGIYGQNSKTKTVPSVVLNSPFSCQLAYVQGIMDTDGSVGKNGDIELSMATEDIVRFVMSVVNVLGLKTRLVSRVTNSGNTYYRLVVKRSYKGLDLLFRLRRKLDALKYITTVTQDKSSLKYTGLETVLQKELQRVRGLSTLPKIKGTKLGNLKGNSVFCGVSEVAWHSDALQSELSFYGIMQDVDIPKDSGLVRVDKIEKSSAVLYDLTVPTVHCYRANGLVVHNTTLARIFGKAVNCKEFRRTGDVCNVCDSCREVNSDVSNLYKEFDATRVGSVEGVKQLVSSLILSPPADGLRRVVVLDEVHACSVQAQTSLLKVLEEGIPNTFFVFCTTNSVIPTIVSRSTNIPFSTIPHDLLYGLVVSIARGEGVSLDEDVAHMIVAKSQGHARNAVSILDSYLRVGRDAISSSYYDFVQMVQLAVMKQSEKEIRDHLNKVLSYSLVDINFVISEFLRRCYLRQGDFESKVGVSGNASKFLAYFYQPYVQTALKDERGCELVLLDFISMFK